MAATRNERNVEADAEPPSVEAIARRFLDLWQSQVAALASDPETNAMLSRLIAAQLGTGEALLKAAQAVSQAAARDAGHTAAAAPRATAATAPPDHGERDVAELARRLAACEARLARLEKRPRGGSGGAAKRARKPGT